MPVLAPWIGREPATICSVLFVAISMAMGVAMVLMWRSIALRISGSRWIALSVALGFGCANSVLTYLHAGTSYIPGLFFVTLALWLTQRDRGTPSIAASASAAAFAALLWFPYVLSAPGILFASIWPDPGALRASDIRQARVKRVTARFTAVYLLWLLLGFGIGSLLGGIHSLGDARDWVVRSKHSWRPADRVKRLATGIPRAFLDLGDDAILLRRYLRKDPFAPVSAWNLIKGPLWKILAFVVFGVCLLYELASARSGNWALWLVISGTAPVLLFAAVIFEPTSPERYLPAFPFLAAGTAWCLRGAAQRPRAMQIGIAGFLVCMILTNVSFMNRWRIDSEDRLALARVVEVRARRVEPTLIGVITIQDELRTAVNRELFTPVNRPVPLRLYEIVAFGTPNLPEWRRNFSTRALAVWAQGGEVWISKRAWQPEPRPEWNWVENEDPRVSWKDVAQFFNGLATDFDLGGRDGFLRVASSEGNRARLAAYVQGAGPEIR